MDMRRTHEKWRQQQERNKWNLAEIRNKWNDFMCSAWTKWNEMNVEMENITHIRI